MGNRLPLVGVALFSLLLIAVVPAVAGKGKTLLDKDSERAKDVGFVLSGSATPTNKFLLKVTSKPRGVKVAVGGQISCTRNGRTSKSDQISKTRRAPFGVKIPPSVRNNRSCSMAVALNTDRFNRTVKVTGKLFHKE